jgi:hypothetical protein
MSPVSATGIERGAKGAGMPALSIQAFRQPGSRSPPSFQDAPVSILVIQSDDADWRRWHLCLESENIFPRQPSLAAVIQGRSRMSWNGDSRYIRRVSRPGRDRARRTCAAFPRRRLRARSCAAMGTRHVAGSVARRGKPVTACRKKPSWGRRRSIDARAGSGTTPAHQRI